MWAVYLNGAIVLESEVQEDDDFLGMYELGYFIMT